MDFIQKWVAKYSGISHGIVLIAGFLVAAYDAVPLFHAYVHDLALSLYRAMPGWLEQLITVLFVLYVWYRQGMPKAGPIDGANTLKLNSQ